MVWYLPSLKVPLPPSPEKLRNQDLTTVSIPEDKRELMNIHFRPFIFSKPLPNKSQFSLRAWKPFQVLFLNQILSWTAARMNFDSQVHAF